MTGRVVHEDRAAVGRRIRQARRELGLTQAELATRIGVSLGVVDRFETGKGDPSDKLEEIAEITGRPLSWYTSTDQYDGGDGISGIGLPAELRRRLAESRDRHGSADAETVGDGEAGDPVEPLEAPLALQEEPLAPLAVADEDPAAELREELERVDAGRQELGAMLEQSRSELAASREQEAVLAQRTSELEAELRAAEERAATTTARLDQAETELGRLRTDERARAEELDHREAELGVLAGELATREAAVTRANKDVGFRAIQLDTREAELRFRLAQLDTREAQLRSSSARLDTREAELAYRSARLDTREASVVNVELDLDRRARALELESAAGSVATGRAPREDEHLAVMPDQGYKLVARPGAVPASGETVDLDGIRYRVLRVQRSPFPGDERQCAVLELRRPDDEHSRSHLSE